MTSHATVTSVPLVTHQQCLTSHHDDDCMADAQLKNLSQEIHRRPGRPWQDVVNRSFCNPLHSSLLIQQHGHHLTSSSRSVMHPSCLRQTFRR